VSKWDIHHGDVRKVLKGLPTNHFDAVLSDPPYSYSFMNCVWDYALPSVNVWTELLRVVKPGAHVMLFGGPRTFHRLVVNVEDAGFIPIDLLMYLHGKGFPKSLDIAKAIDKQKGHWRGRAGAQRSENSAMGGPNFERSPKGEATTDEPRPWSGYGTALKPAYEPVLLAMKMLDGTFAENVQKWGTGALWIDGGRIGDEKRFNSSASRSGMWDSIAQNEKDGRPAVGRWPANVVLDEEAAEILETSNPGTSRFFYTTKVSRGEREQGCGDLESCQQGIGALSDGGRSAALVKNIHPTLKAVELTRWLATMLLPPPRTDGQPRRIIVPFSGAGSEMIGCLQAGWDEVVGIEGEERYIEIAKSRITKGGVFSGLLDPEMRKTAASGKRQAAGRLCYDKFAKDKG
jgi:site-specific DNA-methyltransferase (adenine-specific)